MANVGTILSGAFRLFREKPVTVAIWGAIFLVLSLGSNLISYAVTGVQPGTVSPAPVSPPGFGTVMGFGLIGLIVVLAYTAVMMCAVFRANLRPEESRFASIRFGMDELRMMGLYVILFIGVIFAGLIAMLASMMLVGGAVMATGGGASSVLVGILVYLALICGVVFVSVRFSLVFAITFVRQRIAIDDAWALSRGRFWTLFLVYLVLVVLAIVLYSVVLGPFMQPYVAGMLEAMRNPEQAGQLEQMAVMSMGATIGLGVASAVVQTILHTVNGGATATAVREFLRENGEVLDDEVGRTAEIFE